MVLMNKFGKKKINIFLRWGLKIKGWSDARNNIYDKSDIEGYEKYYYTPFIGEQIAKFISIAEDKFSRIRDTLTAINESINNLNHESDAIFQKASKDISDVKRKIAINIGKPETPETKAIDDALNNEIAEIEKSTINKVQEINSAGNKKENDAKRLIENYHISFNEGLNNCIERLEIYWGSLYMKHKKMDTGININAKLPKKEELLIMCNKVNPAAGFNINSYVVLPLNDIEMIKHR